MAKACGWIERDLEVVLGVLSEIDGGHPARTEFALDGIAVRKSLANRVGNVQRSTVDGEDGLTYRLPRPEASAFDSRK